MWQSRPGRQWYPNSDVYLQSASPFAFAFDREAMEESCRGKSPMYYRPRKPLDADETTFCYSPCRCTARWHRWGFTDRKFTGLNLKRSDSISKVSSGATGPLRTFLGTQSLIASMSMKARQGIGYIQGIGNVFDQRKINVKSNMFEKVLPHGCLDSITSTSIV